MKEETARRDPLLHAGDRVQQRISLHLRLQPLDLPAHFFQRAINPHYAQAEAQRNPALAKNQFAALAEKRRVARLIELTFWR